MHIPFFTTINVSWSLCNQLLLVGNINWFFLRKVMSTTEKEFEHIVFSFLVAKVRGKFVPVLTLAFSPDSYIQAAKCIPSLLRLGYPLVSDE